MLGVHFIEATRNSMQNFIIIEESIHFRLISAQEHVYIDMLTIVYPLLGVTICHNPCKQISTEPRRKKLSVTVWSLRHALQNVPASMFKKRPLAGEEASGCNCVAAFLQHHRP